MRSTARWPASSADDDDAAAPTTSDERRAGQRGEQPGHRRLPDAWRSGAVQVPARASSNAGSNPARTSSGRHAGGCCGTARPSGPGPNTVVEAGRPNSPIPLISSDLGHEPVPAPAERGLVEQLDVHEEVDGAGDQPVGEGVGDPDVRRTGTG